MTTTGIIWVLVRVLFWLAVMIIVLGILCTWLGQVAYVVTQCIVEAKASAEAGRKRRHGGEAERRDRPVGPAV